MIAAFLKLSIFDPTADPKTLAASFAPSDQPRNSPLDMKISSSSMLAKSVFYLIFEDEFVRFFHACGFTWFFLSP